MTIPDSQGEHTIGCGPSGGCGSGCLNKVLSILHGITPARKASGKRPEKFAFPEKMAWNNFI